MARLACLLLASASSVFAQIHSSTTTFTFTGSALPTGLAASNYNIEGSTPKKRGFVPSNVYVSGGYLNLRTPGGQQNAAYVLGGEISTTFSFSSARVDTYAILTNVAGVVNGAFMYTNDTQEVDLEWLSDVNSQSNKAYGAGVRHLFYTNHGPKGSTGTAGASPSDATSAVHNYRTDWNSSVSSTWYLDGTQQAQITQNVPTVKSTHWVWNCWSNGDPGFSVGPPASDAIYRIQKIVIYYDP